MSDGGHLVIDHVEVENADGILLLLPAPQPGVAGVAARGHLGENCQLFKHLSTLLLPTYQSFSTL